MKKNLFFVFAAIFIYGCAIQKPTSSEVIEDAKPPKTYISKECECENFQKCNDLGVEYELSNSLDKAKACYQVACDGGVGVACSNLGSIYQIQQSKNESEILSIFLKSCNLSNKFGCYNAANLYRLSKNPNYQAAMSLYEKSCNELQHAQSCTNLGGMYQFLLGKDGSLKLAKELYKKGCEMGDERGCKNLSLISGN